jgi:putative transposase
LDGRFRSCLVDSESYLLQCHRYIECNPVRAGMVRHPGAYRWSSYRGNALGVPDPRLTQHPCVEALGRTPDERLAAYRSLFLDELAPEVVDYIRDRTNGGLVIGSGAFRQQVARTLGRSVDRRKRGPKDPQAE